MLETHTKLSNKPVKMMERSLHSAKYCFVENLRKTGKMHETEYQVLSSWFDFLLSSPEIDISVDLIVYLQVGSLKYFYSGFQSGVLFHSFCYSS